MWYFVVNKFEQSMKIINDLIFLLRTGLVQQPYITKRSYPKKTTKDFKEEDTFIVVGFTAAGNPICQMISDLQASMEADIISDKTFFMFGKSSIGIFQMKSTYRWTCRDDGKTIKWEQVSLFIDAHFVYG